jgi:hypothetical protein
MMGIDDLSFSFHRALSELFARACCRLSEAAFGGKRAATKKRCSHGGESGDQGFLKETGGVD